ncbi:MAG: dihydrodipicolinate synthase family protein [Bryobacterales bacterium]|nr:dihydrodipicolinate synthase family protein [Bryobacterales bacterium]
MTELHGVIPILNTTFADDGALDLDSQARLTEHLIASGAHGLGLFGNASEGYALTGTERAAIMEVVMKAANGRVPLVVSSGHTSTATAVEISREAAAAGADALMVMPPFFLRTDADGLMSYFEAISRAVEIPIMVQDAPLMTQVIMPAALLARMGREIEYVRYAKVEAPPTAPKVSATVAAGGIIAFGGLNGNFLIEEFARGARGTMPGSDMVTTYVAIWDALEAGDRPQAWELFTQALPLMRFELQPGMGVSAMKHNLKAAGVIRSAHVRAPTVALDAQSLEELAFLREWAARDRQASVVPA